jgi:hypothetical protein
MELVMFNTRQQLVVSALLLASFSGLAAAAETQAADRATCAKPMLSASSRITGHPGRAAPARKRIVQASADCPNTETRPMVLASFTDATGGLSLVRGNTERALEQIQARKRAKRSSLLLTNQCVGHTVLRQWSEARAACDAAVEVANAERLRGGTRLESSRRLARSNVAVAYSNRAVLNWLTDQEIAAHNDLLAARKLAPTARYVTRNLLVTETAPSLASLSGKRAAVWASVK